MKDLSPVVTAAVSPAERRIMCEDSKAYANYMWAVLMVSKPFSSMDLKVKDIQVLKTLTVDLDTTLKVHRTTADVKTARCVIEGEDFKYAFLVSDMALSESMKNNIDEVVGADGVYIDFLQLYKMIEVASELPYAIGKVGLNYSDEGILLGIKNKKGADALFDISGSKEGSTAPLKEELVVQAKLLKIVLRSFASKSSVRISLSKNGLGIVSDDYTAAIYSETK